MKGGGGGGMKIGTKLFLRWPPPNKPPNPPLAIRNGAASRPNVPRAPAVVPSVGKKLPVWPETSPIEMRKLPNINNPVLIVLYKSVHTNILTLPNTKQLRIARRKNWAIC